MTPTQFVQFKVNNARAAVLGPSPGGIRGLRAISGPQFQDTNGNVISTIACGQSYIFDVPGYSSVHLVLTKNGLPDFDGGFNVPMAPYLANCMTDPGTYVATAYDQSSGANLGTTTFVVTGATGIQQVFAGFTTTELAVGAGLLLFLVMRKKKGKKA